MRGRLHLVTAQVKAGVNVSSRHTRLFYFLSQEQGHGQLALHREYLNEEAFVGQGTLVTASHG